MDVGTITEDTFDIDSIGETDAILVRGSTSVRWLWKDEHSRLVCIEKSRTSPGIGAFVDLEAEGIGRVSEKQVRTRKTVGILLNELDTTTASVDVTCADGATRTAYLQKVRFT